MAFLDDDAMAPEEPASPRRSGAARQRQIMLRRLVALGLAVLLLVLILFGIKGCIDARQERSFENYANDLTAIVERSNQLSANFFGQLKDPQNATELTFEDQVAGYELDAEELTDRVAELDTPGELEDVAGELELAFELREDGLRGIAARIGPALGEEGRAEAIQEIAAFMRFFLASDVLFSRVQVEINETLAAQGIDAAVPASVFTDSPPEQFLDVATISAALARVSGEAAGGRGGVHGLALLASTVNPGNVALDPATTTTVTGSGPYEVEAQVQNQGDSTESDVLVTVEITGGTETIEADATLDSIGEGETQNVKIPLETDPETGEELSMEVSVTPVPEEQIADNNTFTYPVIFE